MKWQNALTDFKHFLKIERGLSQNSIDNYVLDVNKLIQFLEENKNSISPISVEKETIQELKEVLKSADLVKFAKAKPIVEEIKGHRNVSERILQSLKPIKEEEPKKEEDTDGE